MTINVRRFHVVSLLLAAVLAVSARAATYHVSTNGSQTYPYDDWSKAATNIHVAVAEAGVDDTVLVSNGVFQTTNTITVDAGFTIRSVNGRQVTTVERDPAAGAFPVFTIDHADAFVAGFTARNGLKPGNNYTVAGVDVVSGTISNCLITACSGGITFYMRGAGALARACVISNNPAYAYAVRVSGGAVLEDSTVTKNSAVETGGILLYGTARRCRIVGNTANGGYGPAGVTLSGTLQNSLVAGNSHNRTQHTGGVRMTGGVMENCTIAANANHADSSVGSGVARTGGTIRNCVIYANTGSGGVNYVGDVNAASYSCAPELTAGAQGNTTDDPLFEDAANGDFHIEVLSPCLDAGTNLAAIVDDLNGDARPQDGNSDGNSYHDMGAYEMPPYTGPLLISFSGSPLTGLGSVTSVFTATLVGGNTNITWWGWDFNNNGTFDRTGTGLKVVTNTFGFGLHSVSLRVTNSALETAASTNLDYVLVVPTDIYVATNGTHQFPFDTWARAATNVHDAVDAAVSGCTVHVGDGTYPTTNELLLSEDVTVRGENGPAVTTLERNAAGGTFRVFALTHADALVAGLTLKNGNSPGGGNYTASGVRLLAGTVSNCVITACNDGIALFLEGSGTLVRDCVISNNPAYAYAVRVDSGGVLEDSTVTKNSAVETGGLRLQSGGTARRCRIVNNSVNGGYGPAGVTVSGTLRNCLVYGNSHNSTASPGGIQMTGGLMENCTVAGNANHADSTKGAGVDLTGGTIRNCIVYGNTGGSGQNYVGAEGSVWYSCAPELTPAAQGNTASDPQFEDAPNGDFHLKSISPCIDAGTNLATIADDLDGDVRPQDGNADGPAFHDMGAYEMPPSAGPLEVVFSGTPLSGLGSVTSVFTATVVGGNTNVTWWGWDFDNNGTFDLSGSGLRVVTNAFGLGQHSIAVRVTNSTAEVAASTNLDYVVVVSTNIYVATNGTHQLPFDTWVKAATNLHDAAGIALSGCTVHIGDGTFRTTNAITLSLAVAVRGNGPDATTVERNAAAGNFRLFGLDHDNASLVGLTVRNGANPGPGNYNASGVRLLRGSVSNCVVTTCSGGYPVLIAGNALMAHCIISNNPAYPTAVQVQSGGVLEDSTITKNHATETGALRVYAGSTVRRCRIVANTVHGNYGPAGVSVSGTLQNCLVAGNSHSSAVSPGGVSITGGTMESCTIAGNANGAGSTKGSGVERTGGTVRNCIVYGNTGAGGLQYVGDASAAWYSCAPELTAGVQGNITGNPLFMDAPNGDYHVDSESPCINAGTNLTWMATSTDLDGVDRVQSGTVDMGAYESMPPAGTMFMVR